VAWDNVAQEAETDEEFAARFHLRSELSDIGSKAHIFPTKPPGCF
jgi:hypothetical protein